MLPDLLAAGKNYLPYKDFAWYAPEGRRPHWLWRHRLWLLLAPAAVCALWLAAEVAAGNRRIFQAGPVSAVTRPEHGDASHDAFGNDCALCHTQHFQTEKHFAPWHAGLHTVADAAGWVAARRADAERLLFDSAGGCRFCHVPQAGWRPAPDAPPRWLPRAGFDHGTRGHQEGACADCHAIAATSASARDVLLPDLAACRACHAPGRSAPSGCAACHRYHP